MNYAQYKVNHKYRQESEELLAWIDKGKVVCLWGVFAMSSIGLVAGIVLVVWSWFVSLPPTEHDFTYVGTALLGVGHLLSGGALWYRHRNTKFVQEVAAAEDVYIPHCEICMKEGPNDLCFNCEKEWVHERQRLRGQVMRAKEKKLSATLTLREWLDTCQAFRWKCAYCQTGPYEVMEHYIPIAKGGGTTKENCVPACFKCNQDKLDKHPEAL
jgi:HNH endonuclease